MSVIPAGLRRRLAKGRLGHLATSNGRRPSLVPVCFVLLADTVYQAIDAKPKSRPPERLVRVQNILRNRETVFLIDNYEEDWSRLWYVSLRGRARLLKAGEEHNRAIKALRRKYPQYRTSFPLDETALVIALDVRRLSHWQASSRGRDRVPREARPG